MSEDVTVGLGREPAFPQQWDESNGSHWRASGMTLRDYFAGQILTAATPTDKPSPGSDAILALRCYEIADAMLAERLKERAK